jgi:hypothetical protein
LVMETWDVLSPVKSLILKDAKLRCRKSSEHCRARIDRGC